MIPSRQRNVGLFSFCPSSWLAILAMSSTLIFILTSSELTGGEGGSPCWRLKFSVLPEICIAHWLISRGDCSFKDDELSEILLESDLLLPILIKFIDLACFWSSIIPKAVSALPTNKFSFHAFKHSQNGKSLTVARLFKSRDRWFDFDTRCHIVRAKNCKQDKNKQTHKITTFLDENECAGDLKHVDTRPRWRWFFDIGKIWSVYLERLTSNGQHFTISARSILKCKLLKLILRIATWRKIAALNIARTPVFYMVSNLWAMNNNRKIKGPFEIRH